MQQNKKSLRGIIARAIIFVLVLAAVLLAAWLILRHYGIDDIDRELLQEKIKAAGAWGPLVFIAVSFLQVTFIPIPSAVTILAGNYLFGPIISFLCSITGIMLGSYFAYFLGRALGRPFVNWVVGDKDTVDDYLSRTRGRELVVFFFMFLLPVFPDDALCAVAGITSLKLRQFTVIQVITRPIGIIGTLIFMSGEIIPYRGWGLVFLGAAAVLSIAAFLICFKNADKINAYLNRFFDLFSRRKDKKNTTDTDQNS